MNIGFCTLLVSTKIALLWEREREREREKHTTMLQWKKNVMEKKLSGDAGDGTRGLSHAKRTLYHWATLSSWKIGLLKIFYTFIYCRTLLGCYDKGGMKWILLTIFIKPFFYERFLDWHNTRFNGLTHIFLDLWGDCYWLAKISCHM